MTLDAVDRTRLSRREREVAALVAEGLTNRAIGERMFISERTVDAHLEHIREKLGVTSRAQIAAWYVAQPAVAAMAAVAVPAATPRPRRTLNVLVPVSALVVLGLVALLVVPRLLAPTRQSVSPLVSYAGETSEPFVRPQSVAIGSDGFVYVADTGGYAIRKFDPKTRNIKLVAGGKANGDFVDNGDALDTPIGNPTGLAITPTGVVFYANGEMVGRVDTDETVHLVVAAPIGQPVALALGSDGALYIVDRSGNRVWRRSASGDMTVVAGNGEARFAGDGASALGASLNHPMAVALDKFGDVLIADEGNNRIRRVDAQTGVITTIAGNSDIYGFRGDGELATDALLSLPQGVAVAPSGDVYISDTGNDRVRRVGKEQKIATVAGPPELYGPGGLAFSSSGDLFIADIGDNRIALLKASAIP